jgi:predicted double-glycine peptidase
MSLLAVPIIEQATDYSCGAACLASVLRYWGVWSGPEDQLYPLLGTTEEGTSGAAMVQVAESFGLKVESRSNLSLNDLREYHRAGDTVILSIQAWGDYHSDTDMEQVWEDGHYVVLVGIDKSHITLMDPGVSQSSYYQMNCSDFIKCWHDFTDSGDRDWHAGLIIRGSESIYTITNGWG